MRERGVVFLMYHELESDGRALCLSDPGYVRYIVHAADFRAQMELLRAEGWRGVSVGDVVRSFSERSVAITFDDGCETDLLTAAPLLHDFGFGATFYITTDWSGKPGYLAPAQIRELSSLGFEIGSHSVHHHYLTDLNNSDLRREIVDSKQQLEQTIGKAVEHFSCPGGRFDGRVAQMAREAGYLTVCTSKIQSNTRSTDRLALGRVAMMRNTTLPEFRNLCCGRGLWRLGAAVQIRTAAKNILGNSAYDRVRTALLGKSS